MNVSADLKNKAILLGLCDQWQAEWKPDTSKDDLVEKYIKGLDFCIEHNYPSNEYMLKHFDGIMQRHGVYVGDEVELINSKQVVLNGECTEKIEYNGFSVGNIYIRHFSDIKIVASGNAKVFVSLYDLANLEIKCSENAKVIVNRFGSGKIIHAGNVVIRDKR